VLLGIQVAPEERAELRELLDGLGYQHWEETENPAYRLFASSE
jgi:threonine dehydratase